MSRLKVDRIEPANSTLIKFAPSLSIQSNSNLVKILIDATGNGSMAIACPIKLGAKIEEANPGNPGDILTSRGADISPVWLSLPQNPVFKEFPLGGIIMWSGSLTQIPIGWALCNGTKVNNFVTPNLVDKFVVGAGSGYSVSAVGGTPNAVVVEHTHTLTDPGHKHYLDWANSEGGSGKFTVGGDANEGRRPEMTVATTGISISGTGESGVGKNLPPYYALYYIVRVS